MTAIACAASVLRHDRGRILQHLRPCPGECPGAGRPRLPAPVAEPPSAAGAAATILSTGGWSGGSGRHSGSMSGGSGERTARRPPARPAPRRGSRSTGSGRRRSAGAASARAWSRCPRFPIATRPPRCWQTRWCRRTSGTAATASGRSGGAGETGAQALPRDFAATAAPRSPSGPSWRPTSWSRASTRSLVAWRTAGWAGSTSRGTATSATAGWCSRACWTPGTRPRWPPPSPSASSWPRSSTPTSSRSTTLSRTPTRKAARPVATSSWSTSGASR